MLVTGDQVGRWVVEEVVTMGTPLHCLCRDAKQPTTKALVVFAPARYREAAEGVSREAAALRQLDHPSLPGFMATGQNTFEDDELVWVATRPYEGRPLSDLISAGPLDWQEACRIFHQVASALGHVHDHALVHRDVNPDKIIVTRGGDAMLSGFELALDETRLARSADLPRGALAYAAPEVIEDEGASAARADLYSLGVCLFQTLTGRSPFPASILGGPASASQAREWKAKSAALDPGEGVPSWLSNLVRKATDPVVEKRLPDLDAFVGWLDAAEGAWKKVEQPLPTLVPPDPVIMPAPSILAASRGPAPPMAVLHFSAAVLGVVAAMGFSALLILFVELAAT